MRKEKHFTKVSMLLAAVLTLVILFLLIGTGVAKVRASEIKHAPVTYQSIRISDGDSLWSIAERYREGKSTAAFAEEIASLNQISLDATIHAGGYLLVPVAGK